MTGKTHVICGAAMTAALFLRSGISMDIMDVTLYPIAMILPSIPGSLMPDIDLAQSKLGRKHKFLSSHMKHRGITHTLLVPTILLLLMCLIEGGTGAIGVIRSIAASLVAGYNVGWVTHIIADLFNKKGVPLLWPISSGHIHIACVKTRGFNKNIRDWEEPIFTILFVGGTFLCLCPNLLSLLTDLISRLM